MIHALALRHARLVSLFCVLGNVNTGLGYSNDMVLFYYVFADDMIWHNPIFLGFFADYSKKKKKKKNVQLYAVS